MPPAFPSGSSGPAGERCTVKMRYQGREPFHRQPSADVTVDLALQPGRSEGSPGT